MAKIDKRRTQFSVLYLALCEEGSVRLSVDDTQQLYLQPSSYPTYYYVKDELHRGRLEVCGGDGEYRPLLVCDDSWTDDVASIACGELGFSRYGI